MHHHLKGLGEHWGPNSDRQPKTCQKLGVEGCKHITEACAVVVDQKVGLANNQRATTCCCISLVLAQP